MRDTSLLQLAASGHLSQYRVEVLRDAASCDRGIAYGGHGCRRVLEWDAIHWALAAEVGEPEGICTVVFDLVVGVAAEPNGHVFTVFRLDAEPGEDAQRLAGILARQLVPGVAGPSIKGLAVEGVASMRYQDLEEFEVAALESLADRPAK